MEPYRSKEMWLYLCEFGPCVDSMWGVDRLKGRGCGLEGAGKSPIRNPGRNWAPDTGFGDVGDPSDIGSLPTKRDSTQQSEHFTKKRIDSNSSFPLEQYGVRVFWHTSIPKRGLKDPKKRTFSRKSGFVVSFGRAVVKYCSQLYHYHQWK